MNGNPPGKKQVKPTREQLAAAEPEASVWVMANAGSGKTHVLVNRVIRLLLAGFAPQSILCLTFTKAAAAEMSLRLFAQLAGWISLDDAALRAAMQELGLAQPSAAALARARRLFAIAIETPGGLKIQTIHAFCEKLLQLFPAESGLAPGFHVMEEAEQKLLLEEARNLALAQAAEADDLALLDEGLVAAESFENLCKSFLSATSPFRGALDDSVPEAALAQALRAAAGLALHESTASIETEILARDHSRYLHAAAQLANVPNFHKINASAFFWNMANATTVSASIALVLGTVFTGDGEPGRRGIFSADTRKRFADICTWFDSESAALVDLFTLHALSRKVDATLALLRLMRRVDHAFRTLKQERGLYDFDDLIAHTQRLLQDSRSAQWVLYKLDAGLSHILVDEAQDTSPPQWGIIAALADEFFSGEGRPQQGARTIFVVGDIKQSIYSFQGADTDAFAAAQAHFRDRTGHGTPLREIDLTVSYRSLPAVLAMVDRVFDKDAPATRGLRQDTRNGGHAANRRDEGEGTFEFWPLFTAEDAPEPEAWQAPVDRVAEDAPNLRLARFVAERIKGWIGRRPLPSQGRMVKPGDILILLQRRGVLFEALIAALRQRGVPVAGADRLNLQENLAVMDLMALVQFCHLPEDDLSLACILKSPLMPQAMTDDDLVAMATARSGSLWASLQANGTAEENIRFLTSCLEHAMQAGPHGFLSLVLTQARRRIVARLGVEAQDATDMLLDTALDYERNHGTSLAAFLHWFTARNEDVKRELEGPAGDVRIMTVHGAKGLEGEIVILPDAADMPGPRGGPALLAVPAADGGMARLPLFDAATEIKPPVIRKWRDVGTERAQDERKRLLYVAMTRARDELYMGGARGKNAPSDDSWYRLVEEGLAQGKDGQALRRVTGVHPAGDILRWGDDPSESETPIGLENKPVPLLPVWATRNAPADSSAPDWTSVTRVAARSSMVFDRAAAQLGQSLHRVLERLQAGDTEEAIARRLTRLKLDPALAPALHALLGDPATAGFFAADARAEAAIAGDLPGLPRVQGRIDRLRVTEDTIWLLDFKTGTPSPAAAESQARQMALYGAVLQAAFPGRRLRAALLWAHGMRLENLPETMLCAHLETMRQEHMAAGA
jgi:ATP-dependent helicase/nuclease subunit A